ncbi:hypothetical protein SAMD00019534_013640 [Acytostelium subglobosum LB1]|uniref:hypothetical protein n=1 Tax=Acytostelium subglobosum LB1 TaxID=1410327 RepID=UPI000644DB34|nr:hypothetical protein SAMD00019534_013640 [Acytostelium subglobosum LB1]GAM18189.1 hypothetical protein SAMD00019534_013640 [Acytostelium subglobosum LB1]|eukprot:XP_012758785.1 hypothetical protein SAMD00019534_013640 [Acytostelium subglobosum LB1]
MTSSPSTLHQLPLLVLRYIVEHVNDTYSSISLALTCSIHHLSRYVEATVQTGSYFVVDKDFDLITGTIPYGIKYLFFSDHFNQTLSIGDIPSSVEHLELGGINQILTPGIIPDSVKTLVFGFKFDQPLMIGSIPSSVTYLRYQVSDRAVNQIQWIPDSVTRLKISTRSCPIGLIPSSVKSLSIECCGDGSEDDSEDDDDDDDDSDGEGDVTLVPGSIPDSVTYLSIWTNDRLVPGIIPSSVITLTLDSVGEDHKGIIPDSVKSLKVYDNLPEDLVLPPSLESLTGYIEEDMIHQLPSTLTSMTINDRNSVQLAKHHHGMKLYMQFIQSEIFNRLITPGMLPDTLTTLSFPSVFKQILNVGDIPSSVTKIVFGYQYNEVLKASVLPSSLTTLKFGSMYNRFIEPGVIPENHSDVSRYHINSLSRMAYLISPSYMS